MTPDMKRLCEAASRAYEPYVADIAPQDVEAIVRAVLAALREPSAAMIDVGGGIDDDRYYSIGIVGDDQAKQAFTAMIDHILSEPATA